MPYDVELEEYHEDILLSEGPKNCLVTGGAGFIGSNIVNKLIEDGFKDETEKLIKIVNEFSKFFKMKKEDIKDIMSEFGGTLEELYFHVAKIKGYNIDTLNFFNQR